MLITAGHNYLHKDKFTPNLYTYFLYGLDALSFISCVYTVLVYDVSTGLNSIGYGAVSIQVTLNLIHHTHYEYLLQILSFFMNFA